MGKKAGFEESLARSIANGTVQNVVNEDALSSPVSDSVRITKDTSELMKIDKSREEKNKKGEKRKHQNDQVDMQSEEMLKLRAALEGKLRSNGVIGSTVLKSNKAQKRQKLANKKLETFDDYVDDADNITYDVPADTLTKLVSTKRKPKTISGESEDEFYKQVKQKQEAKRAAKAEIYSRKPHLVPSLPESADGKRLISYQIKSNRGLTRQRNRDLKNPRKKYREKHRQKVIRRKGQVRDIRKQTGPYSGEGHGINPSTSRSIRFKN